MWRKHPVARLILGLGVVLAAVGTLAASLVFGADFWEDGKQPPQQLQGSARVLSRSTNSTLPGRFSLTTTTGKTLEFELKSSLLARLNLQLQRHEGESSVVISFSPRLHNVYTVQVANENLLVQDNYDPNQLFQRWQLVPVYMLGGILLLGLGALIYFFLALLDLFWPLQKVQGALVARIEKAETRSDGFSIVVRPWNKARPGHNAQFELGQEDFLATDGVDFVEVIYTRLFRYVRSVRPWNAKEIPAPARRALSGLTTEGLRLSYSPGWRMRSFLYTDALLSLVFFSASAIILAGYLPEWTSPTRPEPAHWLLLLLFATLSLVMGVYLSLRFRRKLQDLRGPKRVAVGPVLSKWRVTGTSNDNRRLIVIADGGLAAGEKGVRKFDLSPALFDQLSVGDIVEIEHTPRLRFICRLEVKGHQELTHSYQV